MLRPLLLGFAASLLVLACSSQQQKEASEPQGKKGDEYQATRYTQYQDSAPLKHIGPDDVADAVPRADPILAVGNKSPYTVNGASYQILKDYRNYQELGTASWYGSKFHGHETSNGEIFDIYAASAAHKTLPIPSYARVTNLDNGRSVVVRVNDRGPFHGDRLIDLSYAAAVKLDYMHKGTARVRVEVLNIAGVDDLRDAPGSHYRFLQLGAFGAENSAQRLQADLQALLQVPVFISEVDAGGKLLYRVRVGPLADSEQLAMVQQQLRDGGYSQGQPLP